MIYSHYKGMEIGVEKCTMLIKKNRKRQMTEGRELPNPPPQEKIRTIEEEIYKYLGILEAEIVKHAKMKVNMKRRIPHENNKTIRHQTKLQKSDQTPYLSPS